MTAKANRRSQTNSPMRRNLLENEVADDSSAAEDLDEASKAARSKHSTIQKDDIEYGQVQLMIQYAEPKLIVKVISAKNLINTDRDSLSDPYARIILIPDRKKKTKYKTKIIKDSLEPKWDEQFEFEMSLADARTKFLDLVIKNYHSLFSRETSFMGQCLVAISSIENIELGHTDWYKLQHIKVHENQIKKINNE